MWDLFVPVQRERAGCIGSYMSTRVSSHLMDSCFRQLADTQWLASMKNVSGAGWPEVEHAPYAVFRSILPGYETYAI